MGVSNFAAQTVEHTFSSGRTAVVKKSISYMWVASKMAREDEGLASAFTEWMSTGVVPKGGGEMVVAVQMQNVLVQQLWVQPRVLINGFDVPDDDESYGSDWCWIEDLSDEELAETIELASVGVRQATGFRGDGSGVDVGVDGEDVGGSAVADVGAVTGVA